MPRTSKAPPEPSDKARSNDRRRITPLDMLGKDAIEAQKQENWHLHLLYAFGHNYFAPVQNPVKILDVFGGICLWAMEMLDRFPDAQVVVMDNDPKRVVQKHFLKTERAQRYYPLLSRLKGVHGAVNQPLPFEDGEFDFTHIRLGDTYLSDETWPRLIWDMKRVTQPEGWVEILTSGLYFTKKPSPILRRVLVGQIQLCKALGIAPTGFPKMSQYLHQAGVRAPFQRVHILGKTDQQRGYLIHDLRRLIGDTRDIMAQCGLQSAEEFDADMAQFEAESLRAELLMPLQRIWFRPGDQPCETEAPEL